MNRIGGIALLSVVTVLFGLVGCSDEDDGVGSLSVSAWGEEFIEEGIGADEFEDGWSVQYDAFLINLSEIAVATEGGTLGLESPESKVWDLTQTGPFEIASGEADADTYDSTAYRIGPASADTVAGNATADQLDFMKAEGFSVYVEGTATDGTDEISFAWGFQSDTHYTQCESKGVLADGGSADVQLTIHGDHFFYDDAVSETPVLRFADLALADADTDGEVTQAELAAYDLQTLPYYGVGSMDIDNMWDYLSHMTTTLGHIDGEGHCHVE